MPNTPAQEPVKDEKPVEQTPEATPDKGYDYRADHNRNIESIAKNPDPAPEAKPEPKKTPQPDVELDKTNPLEAAKKYLEEQREIDKANAEAAKKDSERITEETVARKLREDHEAREAQARDSEDDKPIWEREGREPKD
jgi:hypothetical protein